MDFLFWLRQSRTSGKRTITARISINGKRKDFSTGISIEPKVWYGNDLLIRNSNVLLNAYNERLIAIKADVYKAHTILIKERVAITLENVYQKYLWLNSGLIQKTKNTTPTLFDILNLGMKRKRQEIGFSITESSFKCYQRYEQNFLKFLKRKHLNIYEMLITDLTLELANEFIRNLGTKEGKSVSYANKHRELLTIIINTAHYEEDGWKLRLRSKDLKAFKEPKPVIVSLTQEEVILIENYPFTGKLEEARDMLLMLCEIGQHISDYSRIITHGELIVDDAGDLWVRLERQKTKRPLNILLSNRAKSLLAKYEGLKNLPVIRGQRGNEYLKVIASYIGIDKNLSSKVGRKTFGSYYLNTMRLERSVVARMMGLTSDKYLEHYVEEDLKTMKHYWQSI